MSHEDVARGCRRGCRRVPQSVPQAYDQKYVALGTVVADMKVAGKLAKGDGSTRIVIIRVGQQATDFGKKQ
jgi:hypothetical protein